VPTIGYDSNKIYFNDLYEPNWLTANVPGDVKSRSGCTSASNDYCIPSGVNFAFAALGVVDPRLELLPISLSVGRCVVTEGTQRGGERAQAACPMGSSSSAPTHRRAACTQTCEHTHTLVRRLAHTHASTHTLARRLAHTCWHPHARASRRARTC